MPFFGTYLTNKLIGHVASSNSSGGVSFTGTEVVIVNVTATATTPTYQRIIWAGASFAVTSSSLMELRLYRGAALVWTLTHFVHSSVDPDVVPFFYPEGVNLATADAYQLRGIRISGSGTFTASERSMLLATLQ